jgi:ribosome biogenesis GTPase YqeH
MKHWLKERAHEWGIKPVDVVLTSGLKGVHIEELVEKIDLYRKGRDVFIVGTTNVGKSTVINRLLKDYGDGNGDSMELTTSRFPGTTLDLIEIPLDRKSSLFDTPGIVNREQIIHMVSPQELKLLQPTKRINPKVYQLKEGQTLFLGALARFDFVKGAPQSFVVHISNEIGIHRTKMEKADQLYEEHAGELLTPPSKESLELMPPLQRHFFSIPKGEKKDLVISGLGWITLQGEASKIELYAPKGVAVILRKSLI